jgi:hypothetical protein
MFLLYKQTITLHPNAHILPCIYQQQIHTVSAAYTHANPLLLQFLRYGYIISKVQTHPPFTRYLRPENNLNDLKMGNEFLSGYYYGKICSLRPQLQFTLKVVIFQMTSHLSLCCIYTGCYYMTLQRPGVND